MRCVIMSNLTSMDLLNLNGMGSALPSIQKGHANAEITTELLDLGFKT